MASLRGLYPIIDTAACSRAGVRPEALAEALARASVPVVQYRHKGPYTREVFAQAEAIGRILQPAGVRYLINDRADVALMLGAGGVHLGQDDLPPSKVRLMVGSSLWIGFSTHNRAQLRAGDAEPVDYLAIGPVYPTGSKERPDPVVGVEALAALRPLTAKPLIGIGGITRSNARAVLDAGADAVAVIFDLLAGDLGARLDEWLQLTAQ
ncbi:MAG: thiamine phosphate synthase [Acidobacteria bacterium]|nr:thiamine phosphate synthase [Acidobacteriota bacterium]